jgi:hypothetical protein
MKYLEIIEALKHVVIKDETQLKNLKQKIEEIERMK